MSVPPCRSAWAASARKRSAPLLVDGNLRQPPARPGPPDPVEQSSLEIHEVVRIRLTLGLTARHGDCVADDHRGRRVERRQDGVHPGPTARQAGGDAVRIDRDDPSVA